MSNAKIICAEVLDGLRQLEDESIQCVVTSPPYWGLRDYGCDGQLGLERTPEEYVERLVGIFREVRRVLRGDGTVWLNLGDCYHSGDRGGYRKDAYRWEKSELQRGNRGNAKTIRPNRLPQSGLKDKDLVGIPWRVAFALQADGWWLRSDMIWAKPNPMPESMNGWRWEQHRIKIGDAPRAPSDHAKGVSTSRRPQGDRDGKSFASQMATVDCPGCPKCEPNGGLILRRGSWRPTKAHEHIFMLAKSEQYFCDAEAVREIAEYQGSQESQKRGEFVGKGAAKPGLEPFRSVTGGRNLRSVWTMATQPYPEAHFATFPPSLPEKCIRAGTSEKGCCAECGAPWVRVVERTQLVPWEERKARNAQPGSLEIGHNASHGEGMSHTLGSSVKTLGFRPSCDCNADSEPATVLDPFCGAGTTGLVALRLGRRFIGIDVSEDYCRMAERRIENDAPLFNHVDRGILSHHGQGRTPTQDRKP